MHRFQVGDEVEIAGLPHSDWRGATGIVFKTIERTEAADSIQECGVQFQDRQRWFLASHLRPIAPAKSVRFYRAEVLQRWPGISPADAALLDARADGLIALLQERFGFSQRRAQAEAMAFHTEFKARMERASGVPPLTADSAASSPAA